MVQAVTANSITEGTAYQLHRQGTRIQDSSIRRKRSTPFATIKVINKTGRQVYVSFCNFPPFPNCFTFHCFNSITVHPRLSVQLGRSGTTRRVITVFRLRNGKFSKLGG